MKVLTILIAFSFTAVTFSAATLDGLAWMSGSWATTSEKGSSEELWTDPSGGLMLGIHRDVPTDRDTQFEFLRIEERDGVVSYIAQPGGKPPTAFRLMALEGEKATFENPDHDFPQRIIYWIDDGKLCARAEAIAEPGKGPQWCWGRK